MQVQDVSRRSSVSRTFRWSAIDRIAAQQQEWFQGDSPLPEVIRGFGISNGSTISATYNRPIKSRKKGGNYQRFQERKERQERRDWNLEQIREEYEDMNSSSMTSPVHQQQPEQTK